MDRLLRRRKARLCDDRHDVWSGLRRAYSQQRVVIIWGTTDSCTTIAPLNARQSRRAVSIGSGGTNTACAAVLAEHRAAVKNHSLTRVETLPCVVNSSPHSAGPDS